MRNIPGGEIHTYLIFALKLLIKDLNYKDWDNLEVELNNKRNSEHSLDPEYGTEDKHYHKGIVINWCKRNKEWCDKNFPDWRYEKWI